MGFSRDLNVYSGPDSVKKYFDPECHPPLPLVEIPDCLNPYRGDGVRIYAKMMSMHPATNIKVIPGSSIVQFRGPIHLALIPDEPSPADNEPQQR